MNNWKINSKRASELGTPPEQLRVELERMKRGRVRFAAAWPVALRAIIWQNGHERHAWFAVLAGSEAAFQAAYEAQPTTRPVVALSSLEGVLPLPPAVSRAGPEPTPFAQRGRPLAGVS